MNDHRIDRLLSYYVKIRLIIADTTKIARNIITLQETNKFARFFASVCYYNGISKVCMLFTKGEAFASWITQKY